MPVVKTGRQWPAVMENGKNLTLPSGAFWRKTGLSQGHWKPVAEGLKTGPAKTI